MAFSLNLVPAIFFTILILSNLALAISEIEKCNSICNDQNNSLICQVREMKLKITQLGGDNGLGGGKLGGRTEITDVKTNKEVQDLGKYSVDEYSLQHQGELGAKGTLNFVEVVEAQMQVVSGMKYYLKVNVTQNGTSKIFDAVVVVKPWDRSKELVQFAPYAN